MSGGDNGLFVEGYVNKHPCKIIVDTGANVTIVRTDVVRKLSEAFRWTPLSVTLQTVTGDKIPIEGKINIIITFGIETYQHLAFVANIANELILGLDFLQKYDFTLDFERNEMRSAKEDITVFVNGSIPSAHQVTTKTDVTIPPMTELLIAGSIERNSFRFGLIEYPENSPREVLVAFSLVDLSKNFIPVRVANVSPRLRNIKKGEVLAACTPVTCVYKAPFEIPIEATRKLMEELLQSANLTHEQRRAAEKTIKKFEDLFSRSSRDVGRAKLTRHRIDTGITLDKAASQTFTIRKTGRGWKSSEGDARK
ncbi:uncharacterized protein LOC118204447 [Stegodyphus dumicola]|uniref:uncharacterized protein LOC118204447 n=1 Tax=Stegodyphus dumicola TaxID=202533 RepID=UPI0015AD7A64|nr:uncharacterized protein LOC118204447 [Stegodyphus dumicola]